MNDVEKTVLTAQEYFERGYAAADLEEKLQLYNAAIRLNPNHAEAFYNRGLARREAGQSEQRDCTIPGRCFPNHA